MRALFVIMLSGLALAGCAGLDARSASGNWCAYEGGRQGYENCGYASLQQCLATVRGLGGSCRPNPRAGYVASPDGRRLRSVR